MVCTMQHYDYNQAQRNFLLSYLISIFIHFFLNLNNEADYMWSNILI
jgi:hypothetical protein